MTHKNQGDLPPALRSKIGRPLEGDTANRVMLTLRISPRLKAALEAAALDDESAGVAARRLLEDLLLSEPT